MREVKALSDEETENILCYLKKKSDRDYILFLVMLHTGLRISDVIKLRVKDVFNKNSFEIREKKKQANGKRFK